MDWIKGVVLHGDFGISVKYNKPVKEVIAQKLPNTVKLACTSFLTMVLIAFPLGILSAVYKDRVADYIIRFLSFIGVSMPSFWFGMLLILDSWPCALAGCRWPVHHRGSISSCRR